MLALLRECCFRKYKQNISTRQTNEDVFFIYRKNNQILFFKTKHFDIKPSITEKFKHNNDNKHTILKSATKPFNVLLACTHPLITEFADDLN